MAGTGLLLRALRRGLLAPAERAGLLPARYYVTRALDALETDDLEGAVAALEACRRRRQGGPRVALACEQTVFRIRTLAAGRRDAAVRAQARADYLEGLARRARRGAARARAGRRLAGVAALLLALAAAALGTAVASAGSGPDRAGMAIALACLSAGGVVAAAISRRAAHPAAHAAALAEAARLEEAAARERAAAGGDREVGRRLERLEARLRPPAAAGAPGRAGPAPVVLPAGSPRRLP